jgi:hypothetical protein
MPIFQPGCQMFKGEHKFAHARRGAADRGEYRQAAGVAAPISERCPTSSRCRILVNTSFNVHEEPIVNKPSECIRALLDGRIDFVVTTRGIYERIAREPDAANT